MAAKRKKLRNPERIFTYLEVFTYLEAMITWFIILDNYTHNLYILVIVSLCILSRYVVDK